jgi:peptide/nickel transport system permease protein
MQRFLLRRLITTLVTLLAVSIIVFAMARVSGDPRDLLVDDSQVGDIELFEALGRQLGLDKPYYQQYGIFLKNLLKGDFGQSVKEQRPVVDAIKERIANTLSLGLAAFAFSVLIGVPLGILSSVKRGSILDQLSKVVALIGQAAPSFWLGIMFIFFFAVKLGWTPPSGKQEWNSIILPAVTLGWFFVAANLRLVRSAMLDVLDSEYIKLARAKGVSRNSIIWKHALKNALIPPLTFAGVSLGNLVTGSLVTETVFAWPGLGQAAIQAVWNNDYPMLQGIVIIFTLMYVAAALLVDVLYSYIDPRIRYS